MTLSLLLKILIGFLWIFLPVYAEYPQTNDSQTNFTEPRLKLNLGDAQTNDSQTNFTEPRLKLNLGDAQTNDFQTNLIEPRLKLNLGDAQTNDFQTNLIEPRLKLNLGDAQTNDFQTNLIEQTKKPYQFSDSTVTFNQNKKNLFYLSVNFIFGSGGDEIFSGLYVVPIGWGGEAGYTHNDGFIKYSISVFGNNMSLLSPYEKINIPYDESNLKEGIVQGGVFFSTVFSVWTGRDMNLKIGPSIHFYGDAWISDSDLGYNIYRTSWFFHTGIGAEIFWNWKIKSRHRISSKLYIPVINVGWRPGYNGASLEQEIHWNRGEGLSTIFQIPQFMSLHNFVFLKFNFQYKYFFTTYWSLKTNYQLFIEYTSHPRKRFDLQNFIQLGVAFNW